MLRQKWCTFGVSTATYHAVTCEIPEIRTTTSSIYNIYEKAFVVLVHGTHKKKSGILGGIDRPQQLRAAPNLGEDEILQRSCNTAPASVKTT